MRTKLFLLCTALLSMFASVAYANEHIHKTINTTDNSDEKLTDIDKANIKLIQEFEQK